MSGLQESFDVLARGIAANAPWRVVASAPAAAAKRKAARGDAGCARKSAKVPAVDALRDQLVQQAADEGIAGGSGVGRARRGTSATVPWLAREPADRRGAIGDQHATRVPCQQALQAADSVACRLRARKSSSSRHSLTRSASSSAAHRRGAGSISCGHSAGRRLRSMLTSAPAARARRMPATVVCAMSASVRLFEQTWNTAAASKQRTSKCSARNSRSAAGGR